VKDFIGKLHITEEAFLSVSLDPDPSPSPLPLLLWSLPSSPKLYLLKTTPTWPFENHATPTWPFENDTHIVERAF
jgi:hypothetical protein